MNALTYHKKIYEPIMYDIKKLAGCLYRKDYLSNDYILSRKFTRIELRELSDQLRKLNRNKYVLTGIYDDRYFFETPDALFSISQRGIVNFS